MKYYSAKEANLAIFDDYAKPKILKKGKPNLQSIYNDIFLPAFENVCSSFEPISLQTFYRYCRERIDVDKKTKSQQGRVALKHETLCKKAKFTSEGFGLRLEVDAYHEPIALLDPVTFEPTRVRPIHYLSIECRTQVVPGVVSDYESKSENSGYVIELYKHTLFPKPEFQLRFGTKHPFIFYLRPYLIFHDGGAAFNSNNAREFLRLAMCCSGLSSTQDAPAKPFIENVNKLIKQGFTRKLPGAYDDNQKDYIDPRHYSKDATLTTLEHHVLFMRYICDEHNYGEVKTKGFNRAERWVAEASFYPSPQLSNIAEIINYQGIEDQKVIQKAVGIQFHALGKSYTYNSKKLQKLRRALKNKKLAVEVEFTRNPYNLGEIRVRNIIEDNILVVPRILEKDSEIEHLGIGDFYQKFQKIQCLEVLSQMSNEEIIEHAENRKKANDAYKNDKERKNKAKAEELLDVVKEDEREFKAATRKLLLDDTSEEDVSTNTEATDIQKTEPTTPAQNEGDNEAPHSMKKSNWQKPKGI